MQWLQPDGRFNIRGIDGGPRECTVWNRTEIWENITLCPAGTFYGGIGYGRASCADCRPGRYSNESRWSLDSNGDVDTAALNCTHVCPIGSYAAAGATNCTLCPVGQYQPTNGSARCFSCSPGRYQHYQGQTDCKACESGWTTNKLYARGSTACTACSHGRFSNESSMPCVRCPANSAMPSGLQNATTALACTCNPGYVRDTDGKTCRRCNSDDSVIEGCSANPPQVMLFNLTQMNVNKISPSQQLALRSKVTSQETSGKIQLQWRLWKLLISSDTLLDLSGVLLSSATGHNLVIAPGALQPGNSYRAQLIATVGDTFGSAEIEFSINSPPVNGTLSVKPRTGMSLIDTFVLSAHDWVDEDMPLSYRFAQEARTHVIPLSSISSVSKTGNLDLPPVEGNVSYNVSVMVSDSYDAAVNARTAVHVIPYVPAANVSWTDTISDMLLMMDLKAARAGGNSAVHGRMTQKLSSMSANLNDAAGNQNESLNDDMKAARETLVAALTQSLEAAESANINHTMDEDSVAQYSSCLALMTAAPDQLSERTVSNAIDVLNAITGKNAPKKLNPSTAQSMASVAGSLVTATNGRMDGRNVTVSAQMNRQIDQIIDVLSYAAAAVSETMVPGQETVTIKTSAFAMAVAAIEPTGTAATEISGGVAVLPVGLKSSRRLLQQTGSEGDTQQLGVQLVEWSHNPFEFATFTSATVGNASGRSLGSAVLTLTLSAYGKELKLDGFDNDPFTVSLPVIASSTAVFCDCLDKYDFHFGEGACSTLLDDGYDCDSHFCNASSSCQFGGLCDKTCNLCTPMAPLSTNCTLRPEIGCIYWDVLLSDWRHDGKVINDNSTGGSTVCAFGHLTSFSTSIREALEPNKLASLGETLDLKAWVRVNLVGLTFVIAMLVAVVVISSLNVHQLRRRFQLATAESNSVTKLMASVWFKASHTIKFAAHSLTVGRHIVTKIRTKWSCMGMLHPMPGDPHSKIERLLVLLVSVRHITCSRAAECCNYSNTSTYLGVQT